MDFYVHLKSAKSAKSAKLAKKEDCCICFNSVIKNNDNTIQCGKVIHIICKDCKIKLNEDDQSLCPMCRSHPVKLPISSDISLKINSQKFKSKDVSSKKFIISQLTPKQRKYQRRHKNNKLQTISNNTYKKTKKDYIWKSFEDDFHHFSGWRGAIGEYISNSFLERWRGDYIEIGMEDDVIILEHIENGDILRVSPMYD